MATACIPQVTFQGEGFAQPVVARFDTAQASSDGRAILLKSVDSHLGLTERLAGCLVDTRQPGKIRHQTLELLRQRAFGLQKLTFFNGHYASWCYLPVVATVTF
jgi:hypothetical protein